jgi:FkbM family methyltransferase
MTSPSDIQAYLLNPTAQELALSSLFPAAAPLTILDIGACEGEDSIRYARRFPRASIYAFEPLPLNHQLLLANIGLYHAPNIELIPAAVADSSGTAPFHVSSGRPRDLFAGENWNYGNKSSSLLPPSSGDPIYGWIEFKETITVPTLTLDDFCRDRKIEGIDFIHMDVQGAELMALRGAGSQLRNVTAIWLEVADQPLYSGQPLRQDIGAFLRRHGFLMAFEARRNGEGDQFYVNIRHPRTWPWLLRRRIVHFLQRARFHLGRWKNTLLGKI